MKWMSSAMVKDTEKKRGRIHCCTVASVIYCQVISDDLMKVDSEEKGVCVLQV